MENYMKLAFSTVAFTKCDYDEILDAAHKCGIDGVEVRLIGQNQLFGHDDADIPMIAEAFRNKGVRITDIGTSVCIVDYEKDKIDTFCHCLDIAKAVGAFGVRIFLANFLEKFSESAFYSYDGIVKALREVCRYGESVGVEVWVETHNEFSEGKVLKKLAEDVGYDNLKFIWDIIHPLERGESARDTMKYIGDRIAHVHIKDGCKKENPDLINYLYTELGKGEVPIKEMVGLLEENGYDGYYSLEWESEWRREIKTTYTNPVDLLTDYKAFMDTVK